MARIDEILAEIKSMRDLNWLQQILNEAREQSRSVGNEIHAKAVKETWKRYARFKPGIEVWCCSSGRFIGGPLQRGDRAVVRGVKPRARRLYLRIGKQPWVFTGSVAHAYDFRTVPPKKEGEK
jgi:hypothetical protein